MSNELTLSGGKLPDYIQAFSDEEGNIAPRETVPSLSFGGKVWAISVNGQKGPLTKVDDDGERVPVAVVSLVILDYAKNRGRAYYTGDYDPNATRQPDCWSSDGVTPDRNVTEPLAAKCAQCPMAVKGSKTSLNGKPVTACQQYRLLAVVPATKLEYPALRLKIASTSDWDKQNPEANAQEYFAFSQFLDYVSSRGCKNTAAIVTKVRFDATCNYPKLLFKGERLLTPPELEVVRGRIHTPEVQSILSRDWTPAGADGVRTIAAPEAQRPAAVAASPSPARLKKAPAEDSGPSWDAPPVGGAPVVHNVSPLRSTVVTAAAAPAKTVAPRVDDGDFDIEGSSPASQARPTSIQKPLAKPVPKGTPVEYPDEVKKLLSEWGKQPEP